MILNYIFLNLFWSKNEKMMTFETLISLLNINLLCMNTGYIKKTNELNKNKEIAEAMWGLF